MQPGRLGVAFGCCVVGVSAAIALPQLRAQIAGQAPTPNGTDGERAVISGVVVEARQRAPVSGVSVAVGGRGSWKAGLTDERGRFTVTGLAAGAYTVNATKNGFGLGHYGVSVMGSLGGQIVLGPAEWRRDVVIELTRFGTLAGRVTNEKDEPVGHAYVRAVASVSIGGVNRLAAGPVALTDERGEYVVGGLFPAEYRVMVMAVQPTVPASISQAEIEGLRPEQLAAMNRQAKSTGTEVSNRAKGLIVSGDVGLVTSDYPLPAPENGRTRAYRPTFYPNATTPLGAVVVDLTDVAIRTGLDIRLESAPGRRVSGRLVGASSSFGGVIGRLVPIGLEDLGGGAEQATTMIRPDGTFTFLNVPSGDYWLNAPGVTFELRLGSSELTLPRTAGSGRFGYGATSALMPQLPGLTYTAVAPNTIADTHAGYVTTRVVVGENDEPSLSVAVTPSAAFECAVRYEDFLSPPPSGMLEIASVDLSGSLSAFTVSVDTSGRDATRTLPAIKPGAYGIRTVGMAGATIKSIVEDGVDRTFAPLVAEAGRTASVVVTMTSKGAVLSGTVRDAKGALAAVGVALVYPVRNDLWVNYGFTPTWIRAASIASDGTYRIAALRAGDYYVAAVGSAEAGRWSDPLFLRTLAGRAVRVSLDWGDSKTADISQH